MTRLWNGILTELAPWWIQSIGCDVCEEWHNDKTLFAVLLRKAMTIISVSPLLFVSNDRGPLIVLVVLALVQNRDR